MKTNRLLLALTACVFASSGAVVLHAAQNVPPAVTAAVNDPARPQADKDRDAMRRPAAMLAASGIKSGDKVIELAPGGGYMTRLLSKLVGPTGKVYAANLPTFNEKMKSGPLQITGNPTYNNVAVIEMPYSELKAPEPVDVVWTSENYHDFQNMGQFRTDTNAMNRAVFAALKPGGHYIVTDFTTQPGQGKSQTQALHRIDPEIIRMEVLAAGFMLEGTSNALAHPEDPKTERQNQSSDQAYFIFRKPG
jgi:predicted methyltransferase